MQGDSKFTSEVLSCQVHAIEKAINTHLRPDHIGEAYSSSIVRLNKLKSLVITLRTSTVPTDWKGLQAAGEYAKTKIFSILPSTVQK